MNTTSFKNITRAVLLLMIFFFVSMAVFARQNPLVNEQLEEATKDTTEPYHHILK